MLAIEFAVVSGAFRDVNVVSYDHDPGDGTFSSRLGFFDCPTVVMKGDSSQTCRVIGSVRWSRFENGWTLDGFTVFRPNLLIDALNLASSCQHGILLDSDYFVGSASSYEAATNMAKKALESNASSGKVW